MLLYISVCIYIWHPQIADQIYIRHPQIADRGPIPDPGLVPTRAGSFGATSSYFFFLCRAKHAFKPFSLHACCFSLPLKT